MFRFALAVSLITLFVTGCAAESWGDYVGPPRTEEVRMMEPRAGWTPSALSPSSVDYDAGMMGMDDGGRRPAGDAAPSASDAGAASADAGSSARDGGSPDAWRSSETISRPCFTGSDCRASEYCNRLSDRCGLVGSCVVLPDCSAPVAVCGCDGANYASVCAAASAGASVSSVGACP